MSQLLVKVEYFSCVLNSMFFQLLVVHILLDSTVKTSIISCSTCWPYDALPCANYLHCHSASQYNQYTSRIVQIQLKEFKVPVSIFRKIYRLKTELDCATTWTLNPGKVISKTVEKSSLCGNTLWTGFGQCYRYLIEGEGKIGVCRWTRWTRVI